MKRVVARREFLMDPKGSRCLCLWFCTCYCFGSLLTTEANDLCHMMTPKSEMYAGFFDSNDIEEMEVEMEKSMWLKKHFIVLFTLMVFVVALALGKRFELKRFKIARDLIFLLNYQVCSKHVWDAVLLPLIPGSLTLCIFVEATRTRAGD